MACALVRWPVRMASTSRRPVSDELQARTRQQAMVAELGQRALADLGLEATRRDAVAGVASVLDVELAVLLAPDGADLTVAAAAGAAAPRVGLRFAREAGTQAAFVLDAVEPVIVDDLCDETRFRADPLLVARELTSGVTVPIPGGEGAAAGVLSVHTARPRAFGWDDVAFLQGMANVLGAAAARRAHEEGLERSGEHLRTLVETMPDAILGVDDQLRVAVVNARAETLFGHPRGALIGGPMARLWPSRLAERYAALIREAAPDAGQQPTSLGTELWACRADGSEFPLAVRVSTTRLDGSTLILLSGRDMTERAHFERQLRYLADHDVLTGTLNRRRFGEELDREIARVIRYRHPGSVLLLDIDHFKDVNDTFGHHAGDELVRAFAELIRERLRATDVIARLGGDELAMLLPDTGPEQACQVAADMLTAVREHNFHAAGQRLPMTASVGVAHFAGWELSADQLLVAADLAVYDAKERGRDRFAIYDETAHRRVEASLGWAGRIRRALQEDGFALHYQPILDVRHRAVTQHEVLLRLPRPDGEGLDEPGAFLGTAERFGLMRAIDGWVVRHAVSQLTDACRDGRDLRLQVNLSGTSIEDPELPGEIEGLLGGARLPAGALIFEVTESAAITNFEEARRFATRMNALGCRVALDDFGAGFSSFDYLKRLPVHYVKLDGGFIRNLAGDLTDQLVVRAMVELARALGLQTIAEYVGDAATLEVLAGYGVDYAQGFHIGRPDALRP